MALQSQEAQINWNPPSQGGGSMNIADLLMGNSLGSYLNYGNNMNNAMGQMFGVNLANQNAKLHNNNLNAQIAMQQLMANAAVQQALYGAQGQLGVQGLINQGQQGILNNPNWLETQRGNYGTSIQQLQNQGLLSLQNAKNQGAMGIIDKLVGQGGIFSGLGSGIGSALRGFTSEDGSQRASLPQAPVQSSASPLQGQPTTGQAPVPSLPTTPNYQPQAPSVPQLNPYLQMSRNYLQNYLNSGRG